MRLDSSHEPRWATGAFPGPVFLEVIFTRFESTSTEAHYNSHQPVQDGVHEYAADVSSQKAEQ